MSFKIPRARYLVAGSIALGVLLATAAVAIVLWPKPDCGDEFVGYASEGSDVSDECLGQFQDGVNEIEDQAAVISACHRAVEDEHADAWTVPLEFDSTDIQESPEGVADYEVSGDAHFFTNDGTRSDRAYTCSASVRDGEVNVLTAGLS